MKEVAPVEWPSLAPTATVAKRASPAAGGSGVKPKAAAPATIVTAAAAAAPASAATRPSTAATGSRSKSPYKGGKTKFLAPKAKAAAVAAALASTRVDAALAFMDEVATTEASEVVVTEPAPAPIMTAPAPTTEVVEVVETTAAAVAAAAELTSPGAKLRGRCSTPNTTGRATSRCHVRGCAATPASATATAAAAAAAAAAATADAFMSMRSPAAARRGSWCSEPDPSVLAAMATSIATTGGLARFASPTGARLGGMLSPSGDRPRRVGGGFASPDLTSPRREALAAQARVNRRLSEARSRLSIDVATTLTAPPPDHLLACVDAALSAASTPAKAGEAAVVAVSPTPEEAAPVPAVVLTAVDTLLSPVAEAPATVAEEASPTHFVCVPTATSPVPAEEAAVDGMEAEAAVTAASDDRLPSAVLVELGARLAAVDRDATPAVIATGTGAAADAATAPVVTQPHYFAALVAELEVRAHSKAAAAESAVVEAVAETVMEAADDQPAAATAAPLAPFRPLAVMRGGGALPPCTSPALAMSTATLLPSSSVLAPTDTLLPAVTPLVLHARIESATLRRAMFDTHTDYTMRVTLSAGATVVYAATLTRRYTDFVAFFAAMAAADVATTALTAPAAFRLRAAAGRFDFPPKVAIAPWRDAVVRDRTAKFNALLNLVCCCVSGTTSTDHLPPFLRAFLGC